MTAEHRDVRADLLRDLGDPFGRMTLLEPDRDRSFQRTRRRGFEPLEVGARFLLRELPIERVGMTPENLVQRLHHVHERELASQRPSERDGVPQADVGKRRAIHRDQDAMPEVRVHITTPGKKLATIDHAIRARG